MYGKNIFKLNAQHEAAYLRISFIGRILNFRKISECLKSISKFHTTLTKYFTSCLCICPTCSECVLHSLSPDCSIYWNRIFSNAVEMQSKLVDVLILSNFESIEKRVVHHGVSIYLTLFWMHSLQHWQMKFCLDRRTKYHISTIVLPWILFEPMWILNSRWKATSKKKWLKMKWPAWSYSEMNNFKWLCIQYSILLVYLLACAAHEFLHFQALSFSDWNKWLRFKK